MHILNFLPLMYKYYTTYPYARHKQVYTMCILKELYDTANFINKFKMYFLHSSKYSRSIATRNSSDTYAMHSLEKYLSKPPLELLSSLKLQIRSQLINFIEKDILRNWHAHIIINASNEEICVEF